MARLLLSTSILFGGWATQALAQDALANLPNLVANGGFEDGTAGWRVSIGPREWGAAKGIAEVADQDADAGKRCLRLNAREQDNEVDVVSDAVAVEPKSAYLLMARVRQLAGEGGYKVTIDWRDADAKHLSYDNDWKGNDHPAGFANHGGVYTAPEGAATAVIILGVSKGAECLFDEVRLSALPGPPGEDVPDGSGRVEADVPRAIEAGAYGTFRFTYYAGEQGLPTGAAVYLRRDNIDARWSPPQASDPKGPGYTTISATNGAVCEIEPGDLTAVPNVTRFTVVYPPLKPGDALTITYGDTSSGGPGARAQTRAEKGLHFVLSVDGNRDDRPLDLPDTPAFDVVPGPFVRAAFTTPLVVESGVPFTVTGEAQDEHSNLVADAQGEITVQGEQNRGGGAAQSAPLTDGRAQVRLALADPGWQHIAARATRGDGQRTAILVTRSPALPDTVPETGARVSDEQGTYVLANPHVRLLLPRNDFGYGVAFLEARADGAWKPLGALADAGGIVAGDNDGQAQLYLPRATIDSSGPDVALLVLRGRNTAAGAEWDVTVEYALHADARHIEYRASATPATQATITSFVGPSLLAGSGSFGARKNSALFPGLEYLTADEVSSGEYGIVAPFSERSTPNPLKITVPMMAVAAEGVCAAVFWDPVQVWAKGERGLQAAFLSPAARNGSGLDAHSFALSAPVTADDAPAGVERTPMPIAVQAGQTLTLTASLVALAPASDVTDAVKYWFEAKGVPDPPPMPRDWEAEAALTARGFLETAWDAEKKGWHNALSDPWGAAYNADIALRLRHYAQAHPQSPLTPRIEAELKEAFEAAGGMRGFDFAFHTGDPTRAWEGERSAGMRDAFAMAPDGSYGYHPHTGNKMFTQAQAKSIGRDGETNIGTCVMSLEPLMRRALITGDPFLVAQGEKGLAYIDRFTRPQGAENWEVPLACPNLRAAALATRCCLYGYLLTGKEPYLEKARFWATTGLPFIYLWNAEDRPIMRYASISVMGTSLYTHTWFGRPVQWVGLVYADALLELAAHDNSFPWRKVAEGILVAAMQMQKTEAAPCGHVGFYPDGYSVPEGTEAYHWCLAPTLIADVQDALRGPDPKVSATVLRGGGHTVRIVAPGSIAQASFGDGTLQFASRYLVGSTHEIVVAYVAGVEEVLVDGAALAASELSSSADLGWRIVPPGLLRLCIRHAAAETEVAVRGCRLAEPPATATVGAIANGDFEQNLLHWAAAPEDRAHESADAHGGKSALLLDARGLAQEVQCTSLPMAVSEGKVYELVSWVKQIGGEGKYKVTIDWTGADGHLAYSNDWQGIDRPGAYTQHGGRFSAPPGAKAATIILGVQPGTACLFDDISLAPAG
jgi:hypothetical protein